MKWFESVPNFSEGRDAKVVDAIADAGRSVPGVTVLDVESNADHNRCVISLVGPGEPLVEAVFRMMKVAVARIDLTRHHGEHPRMGAVDVVPFVPLGDATTPDAVELAERLAARVWAELKVPVYLYADGARRPERRDLAFVRRGEFEGIRDTIGSDPSRSPDYGEPKVHPTAGVVAIGARPVLIAFNAYLTTPEVAIAKRVAHAVRARDGGLAEVKALGFDIKERQRAQVSMNLTDYRKTPIHRALELVRREAERYGVTVEESEVVGLVPEDALFDAAEFYLQLNRFDRATILERKVHAAESNSSAIPPQPPWVNVSLHSFTEHLAARTPTPGGGSASAAAAAMGVALGEMVIAYSSPVDAPDPELAAVGRDLSADRRELLGLVDRDSEAYEAVRAARKERKAHPGDAEAQRGCLAALRQATEVPLQTARISYRARLSLQAIRPRIKPTIVSDLLTGIALLAAARTGAIENVRVNLDDLSEAGEDTRSIREEVERLSKEG